MELLEQWKAILKIQKFRRAVSYTGFYCFVTLISYAFTSNTTRAGFSNGDQYYASYPANIELLTDTAKLYKAALANCFEEEEWGPIEFCIMAKHFERQGKPPYAYHSLYKAALANCFEEEEWGPIELCIMAEHFERQGKPPYAYHSQYMAHLLSHGQLDDGSSSQ